MSIKNTVGRAVEDAKEAVQRTVDDVKDSLHEASHRSEAEAERQKRELLGDEMTPGERASSTVNEVKNDLQADVAATKRSWRESP
jgi:hypothetical protein